MTEPQGPGVAVGQHQVPGSTTGDPADSNPYAEASGPYTARDAALQQEMVDAGYDPDDPSFFRIFQNMKAQADGRANAERAAQSESRELGADADYRSGLDASDLDYLGFDHQQLRDMVDTVEPGQVTEVSTAWTDLANAMAIFGQELSKAAGNSSATWKGSAAEAAFGFVSGLGKWSDDTGQNAQLAADRVFAQAQAAESAKNAMPEPVPFSWDAEMKKWSEADGLGGLATAIGDSYDTFRASNEAHDQAARVMAGYDRELYGAASQTPAFALPPTFGEGPGGDQAMLPGQARQGTGIGDAPGSTEPNGSDVGGNTGGNTGGSNTGGSAAGGGNAGAAAGGGNAGGGAAGGGNQPGGATPGAVPAAMPMAPAPLAAGAGSGSGAVPAGGTGPSANQLAPALAARGGAGIGGSGGFGGMGAMPMGAMGGAAMGGAGGSDYNGKVGRGAGGFGPGGSGGAGAGANSGAGAGAGAAKPGGLGAVDGAAGRGGAGAARGGMGMAGAGGAKGQGGEDGEHGRPSYLVEGDPDEVFGTDQRTAPPVIGE